MIKLLMCVFVVLVAGCQPVTPAATRTLPMERKTECESLCDNLAMKVGAVVVMANQAGCVCVPHDANEDARSAAASAGGLVVIQAAGRRAQQHRRRHRQQRAGQK